MSVSLAMIVLYEKNLPHLAEVARLVDEIVIVDTGFADATKPVAAALRDRHGEPARIFDFAWCDDFSAARNESRRHASQDWIFWLDADDRIDAVNLRKLEALFASGHCIFA